MLFRPVEIYVAGAHGLKRTFHPECADINVAKYQRDEQRGHDGVDDLGDLHVRDVRSEKWKQQNKARHGNRNTGGKGKPIDSLLAGVEAACWSMLVFDEAAALLEPLKVDSLRDIVLEENRDDQ